jgi:hypothetical protein
MNHATVMSEQSSYSTKDSLMLIVGLKTLDKPPVTHSSGADYWFDNGKLRETRWNWD